MSETDWRRLGFLTPDAPECQAEVWELQARLAGRLADTLAALALQSAEPTWQTTLDQAASRSAALAAELAAEAGEAARLTVADDEQLALFEGALDEVLHSRHVPSLLASGYAVLGELGRVPMRLLEELAGPHGRVLCGKVAGAEEHQLLGRLAGIVQLGPRDKDGLRRLLRHLNGGLFGVYQAWRQTFHVLGVDGEELTRLSRQTMAAAYQTLGLDARRSDLALFSS